MEIKELKENQKYQVCIFAHSEKWDKNEGVTGGNHNCVLDEVLYTEDIQKTLSDYGLYFKDFEDYNQTGLEDKNRFEFSRIEKEENQEFLISYSVYISILTESKEIEKDE